MENNKKNTETKNSILKEALLEFDEIMKAANNSAKEKLAEKYKKDFESFLNEEIQKTKTTEDTKLKESVNVENNKETEKVNESEMKKEDVKEKINEDMVTNEPEDSQTNIQDNVETDTTEQIDDINIDDFPIEEVEQTEKKDDEEEFNININDIEKEIDNMEKMSDNINDSPSEEQKEIDAYAKLKDLYNQIGQIIGDLENIHSSESEIENKETEQSVDTEVQPESEKEVDEIYSQSLSANKRADSATSPRPEYFPEKENKLRIALRNELGESFNKKLKSFINENKKNVKELNSLKKKVNDDNQLVEKYKVALEKYRTQLQEMVIFNTNLANVNNILIDENLALTKDDKIKIISDFKQIKSINESEEKYNNVITEYNKNKKTLTENVEEKLTVSLGLTSKDILDESIEDKTKNNSKNSDSLNKIFKNINYIENRNKKH